MVVEKGIKNIAPKTAPGIKPMKQVELATKWRPLVPVEYQDDICPILQET